MSEIVVIVGGQFGSEAKGHVTAQLVNKYTEAELPVVNVRVAGPNAGHTVYDAAGAKFAFRQLPVGAVLGDGERHVVCVIAAGSELDIPVLNAEINQIARSGHILKLLVDGNATLIEESHKQEENLANLVSRIGSTGKGIGAARSARVMRTAKRLWDDEQAIQELELWGLYSNVEVTVSNTGEYFDSIMDQPAVILVEGTQGYGLGVHGEHYPKSTSSDARAIDFLAMAGLSPWYSGVTGTTVVVVCRVYPIRVAGNSGELRNETTWEALGLPEERTTVTQKVRRVGDWDPELVRAAVKANGGGNFDLMSDALDRATNPKYIGPNVYVALTMVDQKIPELAGFQECDPGVECGGHPQITPEVSRKFEALCKQVSDDAGAPLLVATTGPHTAYWF